MDIRFISEFSTWAMLTCMILRMSSQAFLCPVLENTFTELLLCTNSETTPISFVTFWTPCARPWLRTTKKHIHIHILYIFLLLALIMGLLF